VRLATFLIVAAQVGGIAAAAFSFAGSSPSTLAPRSPARVVAAQARLSERSPWIWILRRQP